MVGWIEEVMVKDVVGFGTPHKAQPHQSGCPYEKLMIVSCSSMQR